MRPDYSHFTERQTLCFSLGHRAKENGYEKKWSTPKIPPVDLALK
jgi:hypothetical protein